MRAAAHLVLTPFVFVFAWAIVSSTLPFPVQLAGWLAALGGGIAYGWRNRHR
jgi:hypothetical protein